MIQNQRAFFSSTVRTKISEAQIRKYLSDESVRQLKDSRTSLYLRYHKDRERASWWLMRYEAGQQYRYRIGAWPALSAKHIMEVVNVTLMKVASGETADCNPFLTVAELLHWYLKRQANLHQMTPARLTNLRSIAKKHLIPSFENTAVNQLTKPVIDQQLIQPMRANQYAVSYLNATFTLLKTACAQAKQVKFITQNPMADIFYKDFFSKTFSIKKNQIKGCQLSTRQVPTLLTRLNSEQPPQRLLILMMLAHGSRIGETRNARWQHINFVQRQWIIPSKNAKNRREMIYPLTDLMLNILKSYQQWQYANGFQSDALFPTSRWNIKPISSDKASQWVRDFSQQLWSGHDLRKRARSIWAELGVDYIVAESLLNHSGSALDEAYIYSHMAEKKREALQTYHEWLNSCWLNTFTPVFLQNKKAA
ncbi:MAG: hypothetical protein CENE_03787 [Candidatus Celerinatantimonas neptuna]|nr:MAG: hypothetical protein CENE_03787 [Candidatus Celerinatantimonas neptuna]